MLEGWRAGRRRPRGLKNGGDHGQEGGGEREREGEVEVTRSKAGDAMRLSD